MEQTEKTGPNRLPAAVLCLIFGGLYILTANPGLGWRDGPEFISAVQVLGVAHPAGFPSYQLLMKPLTFLPLGGIPLRVVLGSAVFGSLSLWVLYSLIQLFPQKDASVDRHGRFSRWAGLMTVAVFGLSATLWNNSTDVEVYTLHTFFVGMMLFAAVRWMKSSDERWLLAGAFVYGLASGNHATMGLYLPGFLAVAALGSVGSVPRRLALTLFFFLIGFSVYLYLPVRAAAEPAFGFGDPQTWSRFLSHITDRKDGLNTIPVLAVPNFRESAWFFLSQTIPGLFWLAGFPFWLVGLRQVYKSSRVLFFCLIWIIFSNIMFFISWQKGAAFLPAFFLSALLCGIGLTAALRRLTDSSRIRLPAGDAPVWGLAALVIVGGAIWQFPARDSSSRFLSLETFRADLESMAPDAVAVTGLFWFHQQALQDVFRVREDVAIVLSSDLVSPQWLRPVTSARYPGMIVPDKVDRGEATAADAKSMLMEANLRAGRPVYYELDVQDGGRFNKALRPEAEFLFRVDPGHENALNEKNVGLWLERLKKKLEKEIVRDGFLNEQDLHQYYVTLMFEYGVFLSDMGYQKDAAAVYRLFTRLLGPEGARTMARADVGRAEMNTGVLLLESGQLDTAIGYFEKACERLPGDAKPWGNLGRAWLEAGNPGNAAAAFEKAFACDPASRIYAFNLGRAYQGLGQREKALRVFRKAMELAERPEDKQFVRKIIEELGG